MLATPSIVAKAAHFPGESKTTGTYDDASPVGAVECSTIQAAPSIYAVTIVMHPGRRKSSDGSQPSSTNRRAQASGENPRFTQRRISHVRGHCADIVEGRSSG